MRYCAVDAVRRGAVRKNRVSFMEKEKKSRIALYTICLLPILNSRTFDKDTIILSIVEYRG